MKAIRAAESDRTGRPSTRLFQTFVTGKTDGQPGDNRGRAWGGAADAEPENATTARRAATTPIDVAARRADMGHRIAERDRRCVHPMVPDGAAAHRPIGAGRAGRGLPGRRAARTAGPDRQSTVNALRYDTPVRTRRKPRPS